MGNLLCVRVHRANIHDTKGGIETMQKALFHYPSIKGCRADQGYRRTFKETLENFYYIKVDISEQIKGKFEVHPLRWKAERTFAWFNFSRRLGTVQK